MRMAMIVGLLVLAPMALGQVLNEDLNSTNTNVTISDITGFEMDNMLNVEVASKNFEGWGWPAMTVEFAPVDASAAGVMLDLYARYHQEDILDPNTGAVARPAYDDAQAWILIYDADGTELDMQWDTDENNGLGHWTQDEWRHETRDIGYWYTAAGSPAAFDLTQVSKVMVRSTNWGGDANVDYLHFANLTITPEPASLLLLVFGVLLRRR